MRRNVRLAAIAEYARGSLWILPSISVTVAVVVAWALSHVEVPGEWFVSDILFPGGPAGARGMLEAVASSVITVTTLVFTLTVVTLQLASTQFSPRLLRTFLRRRGNQVVLSVFLATFVYALVVLRSIRQDSGGGYVPALAVSVAFLLVLCSVAALVYFIHLITTEIRADTLMQRVEEDARVAIDRVHPDPIDRDRQADDVPHVPDDAIPIPCSRSGVVQAAAVQSLVEVATAQGAVIAFAVRAGDRVVENSVVAWAWNVDAGKELSARDITDAVNRALTIGHERTMQQDVSYGLRQLVDMAVKALSTGMNDPTTAIDATGHLASILALLTRREIVDTAVHDKDGTLRVFAPQHTFAEYLHLACGPLRRYGASDPDVVIGLLHLLRDVAQQALTPNHRSAVQAQLDLVLEAADEHVAAGADRERVAAVGERVARAVEGARSVRLDAQRQDWAASA